MQTARDRVIWFDGYVRTYRSCPTCHERDFTAESTLLPHECPTRNDFEQALWVAGCADLSQQLRRIQ